MVVVWQQRLNLPTSILFFFVDMRQTASDGLFYTMASDMEVCLKQKCVINFQPAEKNCTYWYSLMLAEWMLVEMSVSEQREAVSGAFQQWQQQCERQAMFWMTMQVFLCGMKLLVHHWWKWIANSGDCVEKIVFCSWKFALLNSVIVLFMSVVFSMDINMRHYLRSNLCI